MLIKMANKGVKFSEEHRKKLSEAHKKRGTKPPSRKGTKISKEHKMAISKKLKGKRLAEKSSQWKGGISQHYYRRIALENLPNLCEFCESTKQLRVHHKDHDRTNNKLKNLMIVCKSCHNKIHEKWKNLRLKHGNAGGDTYVK